MAPIPASALPPTWRNHGDPDLICVPAKWSSVALFCLVNYLAHCATVKPYPAETLRELGVAIGLALVLPSSGITRAMDSIVRRPNLRKLNAFEKAAKAGALCMVVRNNEWRPIDGDVLTNADFLEELDEADEFDLGIGYTALETIVRPPRGDPKGSSDYYDRVIRSPGCMKELNHTSQPNQSIIKRGCKIHGLCDLPEGFSLAYVPADAIVEPIRQPEDNEVDKAFAKMQDVSSSYSFTKAAIAIVQTVYASITLYRAQGDQLRVYGYAAFGLTVIPYILMSILNLLGQIACPDYPTLYIVHSDTMDEAKRHGGVFEGVTGSLRSLKGTETLKHSKLDSKGPWTVSMCRNICTLRPDDANDTRGNTKRVRHLTR